MLGAPLRRRMAFELGPWDKKAKVEGVHVFGRKLLYGNEHDSAQHLPEGADTENYGKVELHKMHAFWRKNALNELSDMVRRAPKGSDVTLRKVPGRNGPAAWPGYLGKHHALIEEMLKLGVVTLHQDDKAHMYAKVHPAPLNRACEQYCTATSTAVPVDAAAAAPPVAAAPTSGPDFMVAVTFTGARPGYVFKSGERGLGYYRDGVHAGGEARAAPGDASQPLPEGWVAGRTPEGYVYYWHAPTSTSSWEVPTGPPPMERSVSLSAVALRTLRASDSAATRKIEEASGASITLCEGAATVRGSAGEVARACQLLERKVASLAYASQYHQQQEQERYQQEQRQRQQQQKEQQRQQPDYNFSSIATFVTQADACREVLRQQGESAGSGALAALAQYDDDSEDDVQDQ